MTVPFRFMENITKNILEKSMVKISGRIIFYWVQIDPSHLLAGFGGRSFQQDESGSFHRK